MKPTCSPLRLGPHAAPALASPARVFAALAPPARVFLALVLPTLAILTLATPTAAADPAAAANSPANAISSSDWPWWRGPHRNGIAHADQQPPQKWDAQTNIAWRTPIPGRGHGSATVLGDRVFVATAVEADQSQRVLCLDRSNGDVRWNSIVHQGNLGNRGERKLNKKASHASSTVATDGERLFINFVHDGQAWTSALDLQGEILWQQRITDYVIHQGYGSSPAIYRDLVIVSADTKAGGAIAGLQRSTGQIVWRRDRPEKPNYASPVILQVAGREQLLFTGCDLVTSLDPLTGETLWEIEGATTECVSTTVTDGQRIFTSGGYPRNHISAVAADGSGKVEWENNQRNYVPSMLVRDGYLYATLDAGIATCFRSEDGHPMWKARLGGTFSSSPVLVGSHIYATNEEGTTFIFEANPEEFRQIAENQLGETVFASPTICGSRIYMRVAHMEDDQRQEYLYCIATE